MVRTRQVLALGSAASVVALVLTALAFASTATALADELADEPAPDEEPVDEPAADGVDDEDRVDDEAEGDAAEAVRGTIVDGEGEPLAGVEITITTADGEVIEEVITDDTGAWQVDLPGPSDYVASLDQATLPEGVTLRDPERDVLEFSIRTGQTRTLLFATGEGTASIGFTQRALTQALSGLRFGLIIAITAIGLSLIFGTTGLVNFAHGELVTLGAVFAWFLNAPADTGLGLQLILAGVIATILSIAVGGGIELGLWRPLRRRRTGLIQMLVISIGLAILLRNLIQIVYGASSRPYFDYTGKAMRAVSDNRISPSRPGSTSNG